MEYVDNLLFGLILSGAIGALAYRRGSLSPSGVAGAMLVGTLIFGFGGWVWGLTLITFFVLSSLLSHYKEGLKEHLTEQFAKGGRRDLGQTLANGGLAALIALVYPVYSEPVLCFAFLGAMATVTADTWGTEIGILNNLPPRLLTTWQPVEPGTSGGVSRLGTLASLGGALTIGLAMGVFMALDKLLGGPGLAQIGVDGPLGGLGLFVAAGLAGLAGSLFDSLLGATVQAMYYSPGRQKVTEKRVDPDGNPNVHRRGWRWLGNDQVNLVSSLVGALVAAGLGWILF